MIPSTFNFWISAFRVNPIVGCVEPTRPSPFEGMSDEQKEYEAMKLVNLIHELHNVGVVKPAIPGPDGRPQEVDHVLQLQETAARNMGNLNDPNNGSDDEDWIYMITMSCDNVYEGKCA